MDQLRAENIVALVAPVVPPSTGFVGRIPWTSPVPLLPAEVNLSIPVLDIRQHEVRMTSTVFRVRLLADANMFAACSASLGAFESL